MHVLRAAARKRIITRASFFFAHGNRFDSAIEVNSATSGRNSKRPAPGVTPFFLYRPCSVNTSQKLQNVRYYDTYNPSSSASPKAKLNEASEAQTTSSETLLQDSRTPVLEADESSDMHEPETPRNSISCSVSTDTGAPQLELRSIDSLSDDSEQSLSAVEDRETPIESSEYEDEEEDDTSVDQGNENSNLESGRESAVDLDDDIEEECAIDMANVPEDLKEMLDDNYELDSADDDLTVEGPIELLTLTEVKQVMEEVRARDVQIFSVSDRCEWTDIMVIATGISDRHVRGIADALVYKIKKKGIVESPLYPTIEGQLGGKWLIVDCGNIVIHVLDEESRVYYKLEELWTGEVKPSSAEEDFENMLRQAGLKDVES